MGNIKSDRKNARCYSLKFSRNTDSDLIEQLDQQESIQGYIKGLIRADMKKEEEKTMKRSEAITKYYKVISEAMVTRYRTVLECDGRIQYRVYVWEDGEIECLEGPQGDNGYLQAKDSEPRELYYVTTVSVPYFDPWDATDHSAPEDETERETEKAEIIDWMVEQYEEQVSDVLDAIIDEAERDEMYGR